MFSNSWSVSPSNLMTSFGEVFDALSRPHALELENLTPSISRISYPEKSTSFLNLSTISNFWESSTSKVNSGVEKTFGKSEIFVDKSISSSEIIFARITAE